MQHGNANMPADNLDLRTINSNLSQDTNTSSLYLTSKFDKNHKPILNPIKSNGTVTPSALKEKLNQIEKVSPNSLLSKQSSMRSVIHTIPAPIDQEQIAESQSNDGIKVKDYRFGDEHASVRHISDTSYSTSAIKFVTNFILIHSSYFLNFILTLHT